MESEKLTLMASAISLSEAMDKSDVFLLIRFRLIDNLPNLNGQGVTKSFIEDMISRQEQLIGLPIYCDKQRLLQHDYKHLGHMLDESGVFHSTQIGALTSFELANEGEVSAIITTARIPKRQADICDCLKEMYDNDSLKFSFEICYNPEFTVQQDGVLYVDKSPDNTLSGVAVVSVPANPNSYALQMVAQKNENAETSEGVDYQMDKEMEIALAAKDEELAKAIAEKDALIAERDAKIAELESIIAAKGDKLENEEKPEEDVPPEDDKKDATAEKKEACAEDKKDPENPEEMKDEEKDKEAVAEKDKACAEVAVADCFQMERMQDEINHLRVELASAAAAKSELEAIKAEMAAKELEANQAMAKAFAEKQGLDVADEKVSKAIAELDYKMIAQMCMKNYEAEEKKPAVAVASVVSEGFDMRGKWDDMLAARK